MMDTMRRITPEIMLWLLAGLLLVLGLQSIGLGLAENTDSHATLLIIPKILSGQYEASRNWGAPFYEYLAAFTYDAWGLRTVNALSLLFTFGFLGFIYKLAKETARTPLNAALLMLGAVANPLVLINSSIMLETMCALFWFSGALYFAVMHLKEHKASTLWLCATSTALLVLSRPDAALFALPLGVWLSLNTPQPLRTLGVFALFGLFDTAVYLYVNAGFSFIVDNFAPSIDPLSRRLIKATLSIVNWLGILGATAFAVSVLLKLKTDKLKSRHTLTPLIAVTLALYLLRFILLPDELEYLILPTVLLLVWLAYAFESCLPILCVSLSLVLSNVAHVSLFEKTTDDRLKPSVHLNAGALVQDWETRRVRMLYEDDHFIKYVLANTRHSNDDEAAFPLHFPGMITQNNDLIISEDKRYVFYNRGNLPQFDFKSYNRIFICEETLYPTRGWRVMQAAPDTSILQKFEAKAPLHCRETTA